MRHVLSAALAMLLVPISTVAAGDDNKRYVKTPTGFLLVLRQGDNVIEHLEKLAEEEKLPSASITGIGFLREVTFGFYDFGKKAFMPKTFRDMEIASMTGSIAWKDGKPSLHAHAAVAGRDFVAIGGHILAAEVGTGSAEITVIAHDNHLQRKIDPHLGVNVLQVEEY